MKLNHKILFTGGGTGGHSAPVLTLYEKIIKLDSSLDVYVVGIGTKEERVFFGKIPNYHIISSGKIYRQITLRNVWEMIKLAKGFIQSYFLLKKIKPEVVFSKGGFASLPVLLWARYLKIPYFIHESDAIMGKVNTYLAKDAKAVFVNYPVDLYRNKTEKFIFSGPFISENFFAKVPGWEYFGFERAKPVIFLTGGSQGSLNLSKNFLAIVKDLLKSFNVIHQAGKHSINLANDFKETLKGDDKKSYHLSEFLRVNNEIDQFSAAIGCSSIVISRAGSTIIELAIKGKPMILVPWKYSAQDHQQKNAEYLLKKEAAVVINEDDLTPDTLKNAIDSLFEDSAKLETLSLKARNIFPTDGVDLAARELLKGVQ